MPVIALLRTFVFVVLVAAFAAGGTLQAQTPSWESIDGPRGRGTSDLAQLPNGTLVAVGRADVWVSSDGGRDWLKSSTGLSRGGSSDVGHPKLAVVRDNLLCAATDLGLACSEDQGHAWAYITPAGDWTDGALDGVQATPQGALLVWANSGIYRSSDDGSTWTKVFGSEVTVVHVAGADIWASELQPQNLLKSTDDGETWNAQAGYSSADSYVDLLYVFPSGRVLRGSEYYLEKSDDSGATWQFVAAANAAWHAAIALSSGRVLLFEDYGIQATEDGGDTWTLSYPGMSDVVFSVSTSRRPWKAVETSAGSILLAEPFGGVAQSDDQGESWSFAQNQVPGEVSAIAETSDGSLLVASSRGLYRGTAGSWQRVRTGIVLDIFVSGDVVFSSGPGGGYRSEDGGQNWTKLAYSFSLFRSSGLSRLLPAAGDTLVGISRGDLVVSPDLGNTWIEGSGPGNGLWNLDLTPDASGGFLAATTEGIWRSESGTGNWTRFDSFADPMQFNTLELAGDRWIYALTSTGIARSLDAGANWEIHSFQDTGLSDVCGTNLSAAADGALYYGDHVSMDRGLTYVKIAGVVGESCYVVHAGGSGDVYLGTELGLMTAAGVAVAVEPSQLPEDTALMDAYPNPFRDELTVDVEGAVRVGLFDLLGREVKSVQAGSTSGRLDTSDLPAGVYFLRVETQTGVRAVPVTRVR